MSVEGGPDIVNDGLVLYLDAGNTKSYPGSGTVWKDLSGNGNDGTLVNGPTYSSDNLGSIVFDGANDYVDCGALITGTNNYTINIFVKTPLSYTSTSKSFIRKGSSTGRLWLWLTTDGVLRSNAYFGPGLDFYLSGSTTLMSNKWYFLSVSYNRNGFKTIYLNGNVESMLSISAASSINWANNIVGLGLFNQPNITSYDSSISNVQIYNRELTADEILQNYKATKGRYGL